MAKNRNQLSPIPVPLNVYEYKIEVVALPGGIFPKHRDLLDNVETFLNEMSLQGWELVSARPSGHLGYTVIIQRLRK